MGILVSVIGGLVGLIILALIASAIFTRQIAGKVDKAMPPIGEFVDVSAGRIHYVEKGEGRTLLLVHGLSGSLHNFGYALTERLAERYHVVAIDRPGCGHSERDSDEEARLPRQAALIAEFIEKKGLEKPIIVGHSLGGAISLRLALDHPELVGGLAMISPLTEIQTSAPGVFSGIDIASPAVRRLIANTIAIPSSIRNGPKVVAAIFKPEAAPEDFRNKGGGLLTLRPCAFYGTSTDLHAVPMDIADQVARYGELSVPLGMLYGEDDNVLSADRNIAAVQSVQPDVHVVRMPGVGHMPVVTQVAACERFIDEMAARVNPAV